MRLRMSKDLTIVEACGGSPRTWHQRRASREVQGIDLLNTADYTGILRHLGPSAGKHAVVFGINKRGDRFVPKRRDA
jgi:hypothetical protein